MQVVAGRSFTGTATDEIMLGWRAAKDFGVGVGDRSRSRNARSASSGSSRPNNAIGDTAGMFPLTELQAWHTLPGVYTLAFVQAEAARERRGRAQAPSRRRIPGWRRSRPRSDFGRVDRNLVLITAANVGGSILALFIGATGVMNTSLLSFYERIREFGLLRAAGWNRRRLFGLVMGEALFVSLVGAAAGIGDRIRRGRRARPAAAAWSACSIPCTTRRSSPVRSGFAFAMAVLGALYPAVQAARLAPLVALQHE